MFNIYNQISENLQKNCRVYQDQLICQIVIWRYFKVTKLQSIHTKSNFNDCLMGKPIVYFL